MAKEDDDTITQSPDLFASSQPDPGPYLPVERKPVEMIGAVPSNSMTSQELITYALTNGQVDALDKLIALKNAEEDRANRKEFAIHFAEMQREFQPVFRDGEARDEGGRLMYQYASLDAILKVYSPIIAKHGFSYRWTEEVVKEGEKRIWCIVSGYGHEEKTFEDIPIQSATKFANAVQQRGISTSYGKRYSFMNLFGVIVADEDDDAATFEDGLKLSQHFQLIREATTQAQRKAAYMAAINTKGMTDRDKALIAEESKKKARELHDKGITE